MNQARTEQLHTAAAAILNNTGLNVHHRDMRAKLDDAGARLGDEARVYLTPHLVEEARGLQELCNPRA